MATIKLGSINLKSQNDKKFWVLGSVSVDGVNDPILKKGKKVEKGSSASFSMGDYGSLKIDADGKLTLQAGKKIEGAVTFENASTSGGKALGSIAKVTFDKGVEFDIEGALSASDANKMKSLKSVTGSAYADKFTIGSSADKDFVLDAGSGDDEITISDSSNVTVGTINANAGNDKVILAIGADNELKGELKLGSGKDTLVATSGKAAIADYSFKEDVVQLAGATLDNEGKLIGSGVTITGAMSDNDMYYIKTIDGTEGHPVTVHATAAKSASDVIVNASSLAATDVAVIDVREATSSSKITTGKNDTTNITLAAGKSEDTLVIGDTSTEKTITVTNFATDDVLNMSGLTFAKTEITTVTGKNDAVQLVNGKNTVILGSVLVADDKKVAQFGLNGSKLFAAVANSATIDVSEEEDLSKVLVKGHVKGTGEYDTTVKVGSSVDLSTSNAYDVYNVSLASGAENVTLKGAKSDKSGFTFDASANSEGVVVWANNSSKKQGDAIKLAAGDDGDDTVVFGSTDGDDTVDAFNFANDVLYVTDTTSMIVDGGKVKIGKASVKFENSQNSDEEIMQVQVAMLGNQTFKVAGAFDNSTDVVTLAENANKVDYYAVKKNTTVNIGSNFSDNYSFFKNTIEGYGQAANVVKGGSVTKIDASSAASDSNIMIEGVANVSTGHGTNQVWVHGAAKNGAVNLNDGTDTVWFGAEDKNVNVIGYSTDDDVINIMGSLSGFTAKVKDGKTVITSTEGKGKLSIDSETVTLVETNTNDKYTMKVGTGSANYDTNTDTKSIYQGYETLYASNVTDDTTIILGYGANGLVNQYGLQSAATIEKTVKTFDASGASANFNIVGDASVNNTISGGDGINNLNGGGASKDTLRGVSSATDNFYWGTTDGNDTLETVGAEDTVVLYDIKLADIDVENTVKNLKSDKAVIVLNNKQQLTINSTIEDGTTFALADATFVIEEGKFVQQ